MTKKTQAIVYHDDDRSVELRLRVIPGQEPRFVHLAEPSLVHLSQITAIVKRTDEKMPPCKTPLPDPQMADRAALGKLLEQRTKEIAAQQEWINGDDMPYGTVWHEIIGLLAPEENVAIDDLPSALMAPESAGYLLRFYKAPLAGPVET